MKDTITVVGTIGTEPEHKRAANDLPITNFRVASSERRLDRATGTWSDGETNWYNASAYRSLAEHVAASLHKGDRVILTGRLRIRKWDTGQKQGTSVDIDVEAIGHDLLWGTTTYQKVQASGAASSESSGDAWGPAATDGNGWTVPGAASGVADSPSSPGSDDDSGARSLVTVGGETPF